jgi:hypothetical protein
LTSFRASCESAEIRATDDILRPFFASWTTSLIGSDLDKLQSLSEDRRLRSLVKRLVIEDDSAKLDAWSIGTIPSVNSTYNIWPRNDAGIGLGSDARLGVGISILARMLRRGLLQPTQIVLRDYRIPAENLQLSPETDQIRETVVVELPESAETVSITSLAEDLVDCGNLDVTSFKFGRGDATCADLGTLFQENAHRCNEGMFSIGSPSVRETSFEVSGIHDNQGLPFSRLHTADAVLDPDSAPYWLEQLFYNATRLETLSLCLKGPWPSDSWFDTRRVVPKLVELEVNGTHTGFSAENLLAMLSASKESLKKIQLHNVRLVGESSWREVFPKIASGCPNLVSFHIGRVHEDGMGEWPIKFPGIKTCIPHEYRPGLTLLEKGHVYNRRMFSVDYEGPHAGKILENLALCVAAATPDQPSEERCSCPRHRQYTLF